MCDRRRPASSGLIRSGVWEWGNDRIMEGQNHAICGDVIEIICHHFVTWVYSVDADRDRDTRPGSGSAGIPLSGPTNYGSGFRSA